MKIIVKSLPVDQIMTDLSRYFVVPLEQDCGELTIYLPKETGTGYIRGVNFDSGIGFINYHCTFFEDTEILFTVNKTHPLKFILCSEGRIRHGFSGDDDLHTIETYQNVIASSSGLSGHELFFNANETVNASSLEINRAIFYGPNQYRLKNLDQTLREVFQDTVAERQFFYQGNYCLQAADTVSAVIEKDSSGFVRSVLVEGKVMELLSRQLEQYSDDQKEDSFRVLRRSDVEKVKQAVEMIKRDFFRNYSVDQLARETGTNVNKLQEGFKQTYGLTVNKYVQQVKLEKAKEMLMETDQNISQIVALIGFNNKSYFSKIFREKYGVSPSYFLNKRKASEKQDS